jgi:hypothetical protein
VVPVTAATAATAATAVASRRSCLFAACFWAATEAACFCSAAQIYTRVDDDGWRSAQRIQLCEHTVYGD